MNKPSLRILALLTAFAVTGRSQLAPGGSASSPAASQPQQSSQTQLFGSYKQEDYNTAYGSGVTKITLSGSSGSVQGSGAVISDSTVTIQSAGDYLVTGELSDGQLLIDAQKTDSVHVFFENASIASSTGSPFYVKQCDKLILTLMDGSKNALTDAAQYTFAEGEDEPDAALFSKDDLTINGAGSLTVSANYRNGIASKDDLTVLGSSITVEAVNDALRGKDSVSILDGAFTLTAGNDGIKANNDQETEKGWVAIDGGVFAITAGCDGIQAETALDIGGGDFTITTAGGSVNTATQGNDRGGAKETGGRANRQPGMTPDASQGTPPEPLAGGFRDAPTENAASQTESASAKGIKAGGDLTLYGGTFTLDCLDDALHANSDLTIHNGALVITTDDDGIHADSVTTVNDGSIDILRSYEGIEGNSVVLNGGEIRLIARDDGINAAGDSDKSVGADRFSGDQGCDITINGGLLVVTASGDGIDANGSIIQNGGTVLVNGPTSGGDGALDYDGEFLLGGGIVAAAGSASMAQSASSGSTQPSLFVRFSFAQAAGTAITLTDASGGLILSFAPQRQFETILLSSPRLALGQSDTLSANPDGNGKTDGLADSVSSLGEALCTVTLSESSTAINSDGSAAAAGGFDRMDGGRGHGERMGGNPLGEAGGQARPQRPANQDASAA